MPPQTHLLASWIIAAKTTDNLRDRRLVTLAGVAPDFDGLGIIIDIAKGSFSTGNAWYYPTYHHWLAHGLPGGLVISVLLALIARRHWRVFWLAMLTFHLHLLFDLAGSRGPDAGDLWPIYYFGPISQHPMWIWKHQWRLDGWQNQVIFVVLFAWALWLGIKNGESFVAFLNRRWDAIFVGVLRKWHARLTHSKPAPQK
jgi:hypothetical protein